MSQTIYILRTFGGTLVLTVNPPPIIATTVEAKGRDGIVKALARDGIVEAKARDGMVVARGR
ncbi:MAG TPA: hypothetical protein VFN23_10540 [Ktedonobacteraceae bacterium]|nr:hypothetical protein [Ktedonobacteraceae bacterium]